MMFFKNFKTLTLKISTAFLFIGFITPPGCGHFYGYIPPAEYLLTFVDRHNRPIDSVELIIRYDTLAEQKYSYHEFESDDLILSDSLGKMIFYRTSIYFYGTDVYIFGRSFFSKYFPNPNNYYCYFYKGGKLIYKQKLIKIGPLKANYKYKEINIDSMNLPEYFKRNIEMQGNFNIFEKNIVLKRKYTKG